MSTANKLSYLNTTKGKIKDSINLTGANIGNNDTFRSYSAKLRDSLVDIINNGTDELYDNFPKVTGSGTNLTLNNTYQAPIKIDLKGNTSQDTSTASKNILDLTNLDFLGAGTGLTVNSTFENTIGITATSSVSNWGGLSYSVTKLLETNKKYYFGVKSNSLNVANSQGRYGTVGIYSYNKGTNTRVNAYEISLTDFSMRYTSFTPDIEAYDYRLTFYPQSGVVPEQTTNYIYEQLYLAQEESSSEYVPFIPNSPSPDYPQNIEVVTGDNTISVCGKNLFDKDSANILNANVSNVNIVASANAKTLYIPIEENKTYTISKILSSRFRICTTDVLPTVGVSTSNFNGIDDVTSKTITTTTGNKYLCVYYYLNGTDTLTEQQILDSIQIEYGSTATTYEAYQGATYPINLGKNLFDASIQAGTYGTTTYTVASDGLITQSSTDGSAWDISQNRVFYLEAGTYTFSINATSGTTHYLQLRNLTDNTDAIITSQYTKATFTLNNRKALAFKTYGSNGVYPVSYYIQIEKGSQATSYSPYKTPIELCKIGDYQDYIYKSENKWYKKGLIGKVVLDGSENWSKRNDGDESTTITFQISMAFGSFGTNSEYCNRFVYEQSSSSGNEGIGIGSEKKEAYIQIKRSRLSSLDVAGFTSWLNTNNTTLYYILATPTNTEITDTTLKGQLEAIYNAYSYNNQTNISQENAEQPFILNVSALLREE